MTTLRDLPNKISTDNSRASATLAASAVFQGVGEDVSGYGRVGISITSSNATDGVLTIEVSRDNVTWGGPTRTWSDTRYAQPHMWEIVEQYFRIKYTNGTTEANDLAIQVQYSVNGSILLGHQLDETLLDETEAIVTRSVLVGKTEAGDYTNVPIYGSGLLTADWRLEIARGNVSGHTIFEKFGKNNDIDTGSAPEDIWNGGGDYTGFPTGSAETMEIRSDNALDTILGTGARTVKIFNLLDSTGAEMPDIEVDLDGTTWVSLGAQAYYRGGTRVKVTSAGSTGEAQGTITLRHTTTTANIFAVMPPGLNQTAIAAYTVPLGKTLYISRANCQMARASGAAGSATVSIRFREHGTVFNTTAIPEISNSSGYTFENNGWFVYPTRTDIKWRCESVSDNNSIITGEFGGVLIDD